jgi:T5SS/PEP-CTERM-associated repeat protein
MSTLFVWNGKVGPNWDSTSGTITNWVITPGGSNTIVPTADTGDVAVFNDGGIHTIGGGGSADEFSITQNTTVTLTGDRFEAGAFEPANNADFPDDLVVDDGSKLVVASGAGLQNQGTVDVIGLGNTLFGGTGDGTLEIDPGGLYTTDALIIGDSKDGAGVVLINGALEFDVEAPFVGDGALTIGYAGTGSLAITNTAAVFTESAVLGLSQGAVGSMSLDSSTWGGGGVTLGAAGTGHMTIGAGATVALVSLILGSAQTGSGDLTVTGVNSFGVDDLTIGAAGTGTATFGAGSNGTFAVAIVGDSTGAIANLTMDGATWNTGSLTIGLTGTGHATAGAGEVITVNNAVLGSGADASGDLTLDGATLNGGTVAIGQDGTGDLEIGSGSSGSVTAVVVGEDAGSSGTLTIDGADWSVGSLTVGPTGTGQATVGAGATATLDNVLIGPGGDLAVTQAAGSAGTVIAQQVTIDFGMLDVSQGGQVLIGAATGTNGAVAIGNKSSLTGLGSLKGDVVLSNGGLVQATAAVAGALKIDGNITGAGSIEPLMTLEVNGGIDASVDITFSPSVGAQVGDLVLDVPAADDGTIRGFSMGNTIDVQGSLYSTAIFTQGTAGNPGTLTLSGGTSAPLSLAVEGKYVSNSFVATPGATDTIVTLVPCFAAGTRIATVAGEVPVEALTVGARVRCLLRGSASVVWIGRRHIDLRRHANPHSVWPVLIERGAFDDHAPCRDLLLSPDHAVFVDGVLIPVRHLVNGRTIRQVQMDAVAYYHVELALHDVLLAEGLPVESYLDSGDRGNFTNGGAAVALHPDFATRVSEAMRCASLVVTGQELADVRRRLDARVGRMAVACAVTV